MTVVTNTTARQFNLKARANNHHIVVRIVPGLNDVPDTYWDAVKTVDYTKKLITSGLLVLSPGAIGTDEKPLAQTKVKATPLPTKPKKEEPGE